MKKLTLLIAVLALATVASAQTPAVKYLVLGADPQAKNRQPTPQEEVVIIDADLCDSGWGTGTIGKRVAGCYPKNSAVLRDKETHVATAMFVCGNNPSEKHTVTGKVVVAELAPRPTITGPQNINLTVSGIPSAFYVEGKIDVTGTVDVNHHFDTMNVVHGGTVTLALPLPPPKGGQGWASRHKKLLVGLALIGGVVAGEEAYRRTRGHNGPQATTLIPTVGLPVVTTPPPIGGGLPIVTTLIPTVGLPVVTTPPPTGGGLPIVTILPPH